MSTAASPEGFTIATVSVPTTTDPQQVDKHLKSLDNQHTSSDEHFWLSSDEDITEISYSAKSDYLILVPTDAELTRTAIETIKFDIQLYGSASLIFGDECHTSDDHPPEPIFRPNFSPLTATGQEPVGRVPILRRQDLSRITPGYDPGAEASPIAMNCHDQGLRIRQLPSILAHFPNSSPPIHQPDADRIQRSAKAQHKSQDLISIIVPTAGFPSRQSGQPAVLDLMDSLSATIEGNTEVIIVCDEGFDPKKIPAIRERLPIEPRFFKHRRDSDHFNFARMINQGALSANGQILVFVNDDITDLSAGWLSTIRRHLTLPATGALGAWITEPNGNLWHFGITTQPADGGLPIHAACGPTTGNEPIPLNETRACLAVTGAFLAITCDQFWLIGGISSRFPSDDNDVDLCVKLAINGGTTHVTSTIHAIHSAGSTRGNRHDVAAEEAVQSRWQYHLASDPWRNPNVAHETLQPMADWQHWERQRAAAMPERYVSNFTGHQAPDATNDQDELSGCEKWPSIRTTQLIQPRRLRHLEA